MENVKERLEKAVKELNDVVKTIIHIPHFYGMVMQIFEEAYGDIKQGRIRGEILSKTNELIKNHCSKEEIKEIIEEKYSEHLGRFTDRYDITKTFDFEYCYELEKRCIELENNKKEKLSEEEYIEILYDLREEGYEDRMPGEKLRLDKVKISDCELENPERYKKDMEYLNKQRLKFEEEFEENEVEEELGR